MYVLDLYGNKASKCYVNVDLESSEIKVNQFETDFNTPYPIHFSYPQLHHQ